MARPSKKRYLRIEGRSMAKENSITKMKKMVHRRKKNTNLYETTQEK